MDYSDSYFPLALFFWLIIYKNWADANLKIDNINCENTSQSNKIRKWYKTISNGVKPNVRMLNAVTKLWDWGRKSKELKILFTAY